MSTDQVKTAEEKAAEARRGPRRTGPPHMSLGQPVEKAANFGPTAKRLIGLLAPAKVTVFLALALALVAVVLQAIGPRLFGKAMDYIFGGLIGANLPKGLSQEQVVAGLRAKGETRFADMVAGMDHLVPGQGVDFAAVGQLLLVTIALLAVAALFMWLQMRVLIGVVNDTMRRLRATVEDKLHRLPLPYFDNQPRGEVLSRVTNDIDNVAQSLQQALAQLVTSLLTVLAMLAMMFWVSPLLAVIALLVIPATGFVTAQVGKRSQRFFMQQWKATGEVTGVVEEAFSGHSLVKVFGRQREVADAFETSNESLYRASFGAQFVSGLIMPLVTFLGNLNYVLVAVVGGLRVAAGALTVGDVVAFIQYSRQFTQPLMQVASMANLIQSGVASAERVFDVLDAPEQTPDRDDAHTAYGSTGTKGRVAFEDVSFSYRPDRPLIEHLDLAVEPGQTVAIVGPTGAGKTTLVNLIMRFYEVDAGRITLDGVDITTMPRRELREHIGMVLQDTWLFEGSIRDNIAYGKPGATEAEVRAAAEAAHVDAFVHSLPDGYDTRLDAEASNISAGEKQLLTIARAFISEPSLLILDEATSSVDTRTEVLVQRAMARLRADRTSFVIAHRLSTIRDADLILVMEDGRIVEQGTHESLLASGGAFATLYAAQFASAAVDLDSDGAPPPGAPVPAVAG